MNPPFRSADAAASAQGTIPDIFHSRITLSAILVIILAFSAFLRNDIFSDPLYLWGDTCRKSPGKSRPFNSLGSAYAGRGKYDLAIECFRTAIANGSGRHDLHQFNLGLAYSKKGDHHQAISAFQASLAIRPDYVDAYYELSVSLRSMGLLRNAELALHKAIDLAPDRPGLHNDLGGIYLVQGRNREAEREFLAALQREPNYPEASYNLAMSYDKMGKREEALDAYRHFLSIAPADFPGRPDAALRMRALEP